MNRRRNSKANYRSTRWWRIGDRGCMGTVCELTGWKTVCENHTSSEHTCRLSAQSTSGMENESSSKRRLVLFCMGKRVLNTRTSPRREYIVDRKSRDADRCRVIVTKFSLSPVQDANRKRNVSGQLSGWYPPWDHQPSLSLSASWWVKACKDLSSCAGYMCNNVDWVPKRCRHKTGVTSKKVRRFSCEVAVLSEQQGPIASCPRRTSSLVSCTASQSRLARHFRFLWATETRHTRMSNGITQLQLPAYVTTRWHRNSRHVWRRIISQVGIQFSLFGVRSRNYSPASFFHRESFIATQPLCVVDDVHPWHRHQRCRRFYIGFCGIVKDCWIDWVTLRRGLCTARFCKDSVTPNAATVTNALSASEASVSMHPWGCFPQ